MGGGYSLKRLTEGSDMNSFRIAVWAPDEVIDDVLLALSAWDSAAADIMAPLESEIEIFDKEGYSHFVVMDGTMSDTELLNALSKTKSKLTVIFISSKDRACPSKFYNGLGLCGVTQIAANANSSEDYQELDQLIELLMHPVSAEVSKKYCVKIDTKKPKTAKTLEPKEKIATEEANTSATEATNQRKASQRKIAKPIPEDEETEGKKEAQEKLVVPLAQPPQVAELDTSVARKIVFAQSLPHSGSTHLLYACARALSIMGKRVAAVIQQSDWEGLHRVFSRVPCNQELGLLCINGVDIYYGDEPTSVPQGYDYILCDIAQTLWLQIDPKLMKAKKLDVSARTALRKLNVYMSADLCIHSSFLASTCEWREARLTIPKMSKREIAKTTFSVFGVPFERVEEELKQRIDVLSDGRAKIVFMPLIPAPLFRSVEEGIPESILELLEPVISKRDYERWSPSKNQQDQEDSDGFKFHLPWKVAKR